MVTVLKPTGEKLEAENVYPVKLCTIFEKLLNDIALLETLE